MRFLRRPCFIQVVKENCFRRIKNCYGSFWLAQLCASVPKKSLKSISMNVQFAIFVVEVERKSGERLWIRKNTVGKSHLNAYFQFTNGILNNFSTSSAEIHSLFGLPQAQSICWILSVAVRSSQIVGLFCVSQIVSLSA